MNRLARLLGLALVLLLLFLGALTFSLGWLKSHRESVQHEMISSKGAQFDQLLVLGKIGPPPWNYETQRSIGAILGANVSVSPLPASVDPSSIGQKSGRWEFVRAFPSVDNQPAQVVLVKYEPPAVVHLVSLYQQSAIMLLFIAGGLTIALLIAIVFSVRSRNLASLESASTQAEMRSLTHLARVSARQGTELERERNERLRAEEDAHFQQTLLNRALEEKIRLGHDLHDGIIQSLYAAGLTVEAAKNLIERDPAEAYRQLDAGVKTINTTIREVRGYIAGLSPESLHHQSFAESIRSLTQTLDAGRAATYDLRIDETASGLLNEEQIMHLLQISREAISNGLRHGGATQITVRLHQSAGELCLFVQDNGRGFSPETASGGGNGLVNMRARAERLGAKLQFSSSPGAGTKLIVTMIPHTATSA
ncbi:MAG: sensor histidine kinase [Nibricoccus sp.]